MKNLLICVSGLTPQIITETLFCLAVKKKIRIDELYIVTTKRGRDVILGVDEKIKLPQLKKELQRMCKAYRIKLPDFEYNDTHIVVGKDQSIELHDIRNDKHNKLFPNIICEFINQKTKNSSDIIYCSISGGRKSMSVDMAFALSLFGRENDKLLHVLTHEDNEFKGFFPENKKQEKDLELAELPFVRLRSVINNEISSRVLNKMKFDEIVKLAQTELRKKSSDKLFVSIRRREIWYGDNEKVAIEPKQIAIYRYFLENDSSLDNPIKISALVNHFSLDRRTGGSIRGFDESNIRQHISKINNNVIVPALIGTDITDMFQIKSGAYGSGEYYLEATNKNVEFID